MSHVEISTGEMTCALVSGRPCTILHGLSCATFECKVMSISMEMKSYAISGSKVVCDLGIQATHEGSSYIECACGVELELGWTRHDVVCRAEHLVNY